MEVHSLSQAEPVTGAYGRLGSPPRTTYRNCIQKKVEFPGGCVRQCYRRPGEESLLGRPGVDKQVSRDSGAGAEVALLLSSPL